MKLPILSIVTPTYNAAALFNGYFASLRKQTLQKNLYEILIIDGGSTDETVNIALHNGAKVIQNTLKLAEPGVAIGCQKARGKYIMILAVDNIFPSDYALEQMLQILQNETIVAVFPKHDTDPKDSIFSRYINTFTDPYTHFIYGNASNARTFTKLYSVIEHTSLYDIYDYLSNKTYPLLAFAQGFTVKKRELFNRIRNNFDDVLSVYSLIDDKKNIAYAYNIRMYHYTARNYSEFVRKQQRAVENALVRKNSGIRQRNMYLTFKQRIYMYLYFFYAFSIIFPLLISIINWLRTRDTIWLFHAFIVYISGVTIVYSVITIYSRKFINNLFKRYSI